jgi:TetR/AcrR family transcriptional regulator, cholesterol catabolism regulator
MQILKNERRDRILIAAKEEFLKNGFDHTSVASIARRANVATGNIYDYFKNKDEILQEIVYPIIQKVEKGFRILEARVRNKKTKLTDYRWIRRVIHTIIVLIDTYRDEVEVLLIKSSDTRIENFKSRFMKRYNIFFMRYLQLIKEKYPDMHMPSTLLLNNLNSLYISLFWEAVDRRMSYEEMEAYADEITTFIWCGLQAVLLHRLPSTLSKQDWDAINGTYRKRDRRKTRFSLTTIPDMVLTRGS